MEEYRFDYDRSRRRGYAEAVYGEGKTPETLGRIAAELRERGRDVALVGAAERVRYLFTRCDEPRAKAVLAELPDAFYAPEAGFLAWPGEPPEPEGGEVVVCCAGTSDLPVAREAELTARFLGRRVTLLADVGVAGLHRLLSETETLQRAAVVVGVAGMEGALVPVIAGLVACPVVALPTSVGYGANLGGVTALLAMLSTCSPGVGVVNIDNGYGAGYLAAQIAGPKREG